MPLIIKSRVPCPSGRFSPHHLAATNNSPPPKKRLNTTQPAQYVVVVSLDINTILIRKAHHEPPGKSKLIIFTHSHPKPIHEVNMSTLSGITRSPLPARTPRHPTRTTSKFSEVMDENHPNKKTPCKVCPGASNST